jgi:hypothetical protein
LTNERIDRWLAAVLATDVAGYDLAVNSSTAWTTKR